MGIASCVLDIRCMFALLLHLPQFGAVTSLGQLVLDWAEGTGLCTGIIPHIVLLHSCPMQFGVVFIMDSFVYQNAPAHVSTAEDALPGDEILPPSENEDNNDADVQW